MTEITVDDLCSLIEENCYVKKCTPNKKKDKNSFSYLVDKDLSQSECIKLGIGLESVFQDIILKNTKLLNIKPKDKKNKKQRDHLFLDKKNKKIYYSELKANIHLDTEKSKSTYLKCLFIFEELKTEFPEHEIIWTLLGYRYINNEEIPSFIKNKYLSVKDNLVGINEYFQILGINITFTKETYRKFINKTSELMFNNS